MSWHRRVATHTSTCKTHWRVPLDTMRQEETARRDETSTPYMICYMQSNILSQRQGHIIQTNICKSTNVSHALLTKVNAINKVVNSAVTDKHKTIKITNLITLIKAYLDFCSTCMATSSHHAHLHIDYELFNQYYCLS